MRLLPFAAAGLASDHEVFGVDEAWDKDLPLRLEDLALAFGLQSLAKRFNLAVPEKNVPRLIQFEGGIENPDIFNEISFSLHASPFTPQ